MKWYNLVWILKIKLINVKLIWTRTITGGDLTASRVFTIFFSQIWPVSLFHVKQFKTRPKLLYKHSDQVWRLSQKLTITYFLTNDLLFASTRAMQSQTQQSFHADKHSLENIWRKIWTQGNSRVFVFLGLYLVTYIFTWCYPICFSWNLTYHIF